MTMKAKKERISKSEVQSRVLSAYKAFKSAGKDRFNSQAEYDLEHAYRLAIANGNLMAGSADMMNDINVVVTSRGNAKVFYKGCVIGYYKPGPELEGIRTSIKNWLKEKWFVEQIND